MPAKHTNNSRLLLHTLAALAMVLCFAGAFYSIQSSKQPAGSNAAAATNPATAPGGSPSPGDSLRSITAFATDIGNHWWSYAAAIAMVSTLSMALVEFFKGVLDIRRWYQQWRLETWIQGKAFNDLVFLAIGDWKSLDALCSQPIEKMMGEIQPAANIALDAPDQYPELYKFLTDTDARDNGEDRAAKDRKRHLDRVEHPNVSLQQSQTPDPEAREASKARLRLANLVSRKLDAFQLRTQYYWDRGNQFAAITFSVTICLAAVTQDGQVTGEKFLFGLVSGIVSPFVKDLASNLSQFAGKS